MGASQSLQKVNYEDVQHACSSNEYIIINTLPAAQQGCLIKKTINCNQEEELLNNMMKANNTNKIIVYGLNYNDETIYKKYNHLQKCGFGSVYLYVGGLFEWLCLQDIFGEELFATTQVELDILKYKPISCFNQKLITNFAHNT
jgi:hypothetical protein